MECTSFDQIWVGLGCSLRHCSIIYTYTLLEKVFQVCSSAVPVGVPFFWFLVEHFCVTTKKGSSKGYLMGYPKGSPMGVAE
jgi:hypothetical protein